MNRLDKFLLLGVCAFGAVSVSAEDIPQNVIDFMPQVMNASPYLPENLADTYINCPVGEGDSEDYRTAGQIDYSSPDWEQRVAGDWGYFSVNEEDGRVLVIDIAKTGNGIGYRYLGNNTQQQLFEPWSASKVMAFTAAVSKARQSGVGAYATVSGVPVADLITSIHSYEPFGQADGDSNAIATYLLNAAGRDYATALFHDDWLQLANEKVMFRGAYAVKVFSPEDNRWQSLSSDASAPLPYYAKGSDDPGYAGYRCEDCGLTGNKPMTTLALAEWLKRLAVHEREPKTRHPNIEQEDLQVLFYGKGHSDANHKVGGMMQGISTMLHRAVANAIAGDKVADPKATLDRATDGKWRIWQKIGWGPSGTRGSGENVVLAHVCLPGYQGGREFTIAAQTAVPGDEEIKVNYAGIKMQKLLNATITEYMDKPVN